MPNSLPLPVRVAAGLLASGIHTLRTLPETLPGLGIQLAGSVTKAGLRIQQEVNELAALGDELLASKPPAQEHPAWARFDDDEPDTAETTTGTATEIATETAPESPDVPTPEAATNPTAPNSTATNPTAPKPGRDNPAESATARALPLPDYDDMTLAQVRGHLRRLTLSDLRTLLAYEQATANRAPLLTLLGNRITTVEHGQ